MGNKVAGLYVKLARILAALEAAGEEIDLPAADGLSARVERNESGWTVVEYR